MHTTTTDPVPFALPDPSNAVITFLSKHAHAQPLQSANGARDESAVLALGAIVIAATLWKLYGPTLAAGAREALIKHVDLYINTAWSYRTIPGALNGTNALACAAIHERAAERVASVLAALEAAFPAELI
ncbi:hypothetical protein [Nocardia tengchongensis]|uniref:hypothetical protein n=1 Tax=Nocardia tengchongensis TaxID=2055889 RepID=UPI003647F2C5